MMSRTDKKGEEKGQLTMFSLDPMNPPLFKCAESQSHRIILFAAILARGAKLCEDGARASLGRNSRGRQWRVARERERENDEGRRVARGRGLRLKRAVHTPSANPSPPNTPRAGCSPLPTRGRAASSPRRSCCRGKPCSMRSCSWCAIVCLSVRSRLPWVSPPALALAPPGKWDIQ